MRTQFLLECMMWVFLASWIAGTTVRVRDSFADTVVCRVLFSGFVLGFMIQSTHWYYFTVSHAAFYRSGEAKWMITILSAATLSALVLMLIFRFGRIMEHVANRVKQWFNRVFDEKDTTKNNPISEIERDADWWKNDGRPPRWKNN